VAHPRSFKTKFLFITHAFTVFKQKPLSFAFRPIALENHFGYINTKMQPSKANNPSWCRMEDKKKEEKGTDSLTEMAQNVEVRLTESLLRWKYRRQGKIPPADDRLKDQSKAITEQVHEILLRRGKSIWKELKSRTEKE
jgi:hypothetical protein